MATHHDRPGGRLLEVLLALGLAVLSGGAILAGLALCVGGLMAAYMALFQVDPILAYGLLAASTGVTIKFVGPVMGTIWKALSAVWTPFLTFYGYEAHTLRPLRDEKTVAPPEGREKNEG